MNLDTITRTLGGVLGAVPRPAISPVLDSAVTRKALEGTGLTARGLKGSAGVPLRFGRKSLPGWSRRSDSPLAGRRVVITGASSGIGHITALKVAAEGGIPILIARSADKLEQAKAEIEATGGTAYAYSCDITDGDSVDVLVKQLLADHESIDMLVNNAGRSIRRSVKLSYDRFHDFERTMAINYFGAVRLIMGLLPHMTERGFGHVVNVSSIGVQTNTPRFSAYVASKAALDAFSRVAASEVHGDGVTFTTIHMPLVRTPMIAPTKMYDRFPTLSPDQAGDLVLKALKDRPKDISTTLGTAGEVLYTLAPKTVDRILHVAYRVFPDSAAARGVKNPAGDVSQAESRLTPDAIAMTRLFPGVHW